MPVGAKAHILINGAPVVELSNLDVEYAGGSVWMKGVHGTVGVSQREPEVTITATYKILTSDESDNAINCINGSLVDVQTWFGTKTTVGQYVFQTVKESQGTDADAEGTCTLTGPATEPR